MNIPKRTAKEKRKTPPLPGLDTPEEKIQSLTEKMEVLETTVSIYKQALAGLKQDEVKFRTIVDHSAVAIMLADNQECLSSWNRFAERLLGMTQKDLEMRPIRSLYPEKEW